MANRVTLQEIIDGILEEQKSLKSKKEQVKKLIENLENRLPKDGKMSYRQISAHLQGEVIKALVTAHNLDIQLSNTILKSYDQLAKLIKDEMNQDISGDILSAIVQQLTESTPNITVGGTDE